jgi:hypothetical protein
MATQTWPMTDQPTDPCAPWPGAGERSAETGAERRVGVELEFLGLDASSAATVIQARLGGALSEISRHRVVVRDAALGDFRVELDMKYAHDAPEPEDAESEGAESADSVIGRGLSSALRAFAGDVATGLLPMEVICPPIPLSQARQLDVLLADLRDQGAIGGKDNPLLAVGAQFNPEPPALDAATILAHLRAFILLEDWLFDEIQIDVSRRILGFASPFPKPYAAKVLHPRYAPDIDRLIDDYIADNPTRNRALDLLPLMRFIDEERVVAQLPNETINARPTFHYRLPNADLDDAEWSLCKEWRRWRVIERLAARPTALRIAAEERLVDDAHMVTRWKTAARLLARLTDAGPEDGAGPLCEPVDPGEAGAATPDSEVAE